MEKCDVLVIGGGVIGLSIGIALLQSDPSIKVIITEKEKSLNAHASGRNSGVLHAGFYYSPDSLKAIFCKDGNTELRKLAKRHGILIRDVGKVVVTRNESENARLDLLLMNGIKNGVDVELKAAKELKTYEPLALTYERFLWSPTTGVTDPVKINIALASDFVSLGGKIDFETRTLLSSSNGEIIDSSGKYQAKHYVNAAGAQADKISRKIGVGLDYAMIPFMGLYRITDEFNLPLRRLVYPVPHAVNPFLGVHFTLTIDNKVKIGPTAIPVIGREQYSISKGWSGVDFVQSVIGMKSLVLGGSHDVKSIFWSEWPKFFEGQLIKACADLVPHASKVEKWQKKPPGIRAQLVHLPTGRLEQDFVIRKMENSTHILNAVSPGWTSAIPFARWVAQEIIHRA
jgi:L-2-hydroxyglutarate oxidase LhgO